MTEGQEPEVEQERRESYSREEMSAVRNEAKNYRLKLRETERMVEDLNAELKGLKDRDKSELERIVEEKADLERRLTEMEREKAEAALRATIIAEATKAKIVDPDAAYRLLDMAEVDPSDPRSLTRALANLVKERPYLAQPEDEPPTPGVGGRPIQGKPSTDEMWAEMLRRGASSA